MESHFKAIQTTLQSAKLLHLFYESIKGEGFQISSPVQIWCWLYWKAKKRWEGRYLTGLCSSNTKILNRSAPLLSVSCWEKRKQKQTSEIYSEQNKKGATVAEELGICTNPQRQSERGGERDSCRILTQNMLVCPQKVHPNTITTPTTWIAAALYSTIFCHMYLVRLSTRGRSWWRHLFQVRYVMGISKS